MVQVKDVRYIKWDNGSFPLKYAHKTICVFILIMNKVLEIL